MFIFKNLNHRLYILLRIQTFHLYLIFYLIHIIEKIIMLIFFLIYKQYLVFHIPNIIHLLIHLLTVHTFEDIRI